VACDHAGELCGCCSLCWTEEKKDFVTAPLIVFVHSSRHFNVPFSFASLTIVFLGFFMNTVIPSSSSTASFASWSVASEIYMLKAK
jgi:hypothetical protein